MSTLDCLLGTILPDVGAEHLSARSEHDVSASMMSTQLLTSLSVDTYMHGLTLEGIGVRELSVEDVQDDLADLLCIHDLEWLFDSLYFYLTSIVLLSTRCRIDSTAVDNQNISFSTIKNISENIHNLSFKVH